MNNHNYSRLSRRLVLVAVMFFVAGCSHMVGNPPYPPDFDYADGEELRSRMHQLAYELRQLDLALVTEHDDRPDFQRGVVDNLRNIERIGGFLQAGDLSSKHPFLQDDMIRFLADVRKARTDALLSPPRYYMTGRISGACINCHQANR